MYVCTYVFGDKNSQLMIVQYKVTCLLHIMIRTYYSFLDDEWEEKMRSTEFFREISDGNKHYVSGFLANIHKVHEKPSEKDKERVARYYLEYYESEPIKLAAHKPMTRDVYVLGFVYWTTAI